MCSWRFIHWKLKCRRFIPFLRFVHENLKIWIGDFSLEYLFMEICPLKIWIGDLSLANLFVEICPLKICSGDFSFWNFVLGIYPLEIYEIYPLNFFVGDLFFWKFDFRKFFLFEKCFRRFIILKSLLGDLSFWKFYFRRFFLFEKCFRRFILLEFCQEICPLKIEVQEIFPLLISCKKNKSWFLVS